MAKHTGGCHCGAVRYEVETDLAQVISCNCSHCDIKGLVLNFVPKSNFTLLQGEDSLSTYLFNKHVIQHRFCRQCGVESFGGGTGPDGQEMRAINVRCLDGVDWKELKAFPYNGKDM